MRCPACRAAVEQGPDCRRCRADLSLLFALEEHRARLLADARTAAARGQAETAVALASKADGLRSDAESRQLLALGHLLRRDFARALHYYQESDR